MNSAATPALKVAILGTPGLVEDHCNKTTREIFRVVGGNLGNLAFQRATYLHIADDKEVIPYGFAPADIRGRYRLICVPAANFLHNNFSFGDLAARLEATGLPLMVLGLGMQASRSIDEISLQPGTTRLLALFAERCETIFVRGAHTGAFLERQGVHNFEPLGCPSNFLTPNPLLGRIIGRLTRRVVAEGPERIAFAPTLYPHNQKLETALRARMGEALWQIICQEPVEAAALARGTRNAALAEWEARDAGLLSAAAPEERAALRRMLVAPLSIDAWIESYRRADLVVGTRIHGVSLGWQAGRPSVLVGHDLRTRELADAMGLPLAAPDEVHAAQSLAPLIERIAERAAEYDAHRAGLAARYVALLERHGVTPAEGLRQLAAPVAAPDAAARTQQAQIATMARPAPPAPHGLLESCSPQAVSGWVQGASPAEAAVEIWVDGALAGQVVPDERLPGMDADAWAFNWQPPAAWLDLAAVRIEARQAASGRNLGGSPRVARFDRARPGAVLEGRDGVLFMGEGAGDALAQARGERPLDAAALAGWRHFLRGFNDVMGRLGAVGHLLISPGKEVVMADHLPSGQLVSEQRACRQIEAIAREEALAKVRVSYPLDLLAAMPVGRAFTRGDTHWTQPGAVAALHALWASDRPPPGEVRFPVEGELWGTTYQQGDLMLWQGHSTLEARPICQRPRQMKPLSPARATGPGAQRAYCSTDPRAAGRAVLFHDWLGEAFLGAMAEQFASLVAVFSDGLDSELIELQGADTVVVEVGERFLLRPPAIT